MNHFFLILISTSGWVSFFRGWNGRRREMAYKVGEASWVGVGCLMWRLLLHNMKPLGIVILK